MGHLNAHKQFCREKTTRGWTKQRASATPPGGESDGLNTRQLQLYVTQICYNVPIAGGEMFLLLLTKEKSFHNIYISLQHDKCHVPSSGLFSPLKTSIDYYPTAKCHGKYIIMRRAVIIPGKQLYVSSRKFYKP